VSRYFLKNQNFLYKTWLLGVIPDLIILADNTHFKKQKQGRALLRELPD
jgi:hypothetical protein